MVRFSCFSTPPVNRSQRVAQDSAMTLQPNYPNVTKDQSTELVKGSVRSNLMLDNNSTSSHSQRNFWRSNGKHVKLLGDEQKILQKLPIKKSRSLGNILERANGSGDDTAQDSDSGQENSFDLLNGWNMREVRETSDNNTNSTENLHLENDGKNYKNQQKENDLIKSNDIFTENPMHHKLLSSAEVLKQTDRDWHAVNVEQADDYVANTSRKNPTLSRSYSVANLRANMSQSVKNAGSHVRIFRRSRSFSDLNNSTTLEPGLQNGDNYFDSGGTVEKNVIISCSKNLVLNGQFQSYDDTKEGDFSLVKGNNIMDQNTDGKILRFKLDNDKKAASNLQYNANIPDVLRIFEENEMESSHCNWEQLTPQELSMRRVESWISQIDINGDLVVEEQEESSTSVSKEEPQILDEFVPPKLDSRSSLAMEVAYNYVSSLTTSSSSAQMANLGLISVPILSSFVSLRVLNLSGNAIVHITPGSLPKGLHMLNLSKNKISAIEGLRDLSRLRVLDLNYNRITRIGHGLASCSSIKELYLAGNKISEVEGLHRLLKLNVLDLRFNRISTAKGLGQLAANYGSLQAINLEGNPAQRNVGDEQLRKFLLGLLPNLVYYNKQAIRMAPKEASVRAERAAASPQFDRGTRNDRNLSRRGSHGPNLNQLAAQHGQQIVATTPSRKPSSKERHVRLQLPPAPSALTKLRSDAGKKPTGLSATDAMKRSKSMGGLGSLFKS